MTEYYHNKYRVPSARAIWWDYGWNGAYYFTICTKNRKYFFGDIENDKMIFSDVGKLAWEKWEDIPNHSPFTELDTFIVMPNHIHGILIINKPEDDDSIGDISFYQSQCKGDGEKPFHPRFQNPGSGTLSSILGSFKSAVTKECHLQGWTFGWQARFYDRIIRDFDEYQRI